LAWVSSYISGQPPKAISAASAVLLPPTAARSSEHIPCKHKVAVGLMRACYGPSFKLFKRHLQLLTHTLVPGLKHFHFVSKVTLITRRLAKQANKT